jgi:hypothetical protein
MKNAYIALKRKENPVAETFGNHESVNLTFRHANDWFNPFHVRSLRGNEST